MDDTQQSRTSDAAATRKRRSSILKSQRPPRAPFSELEFNVATPTDSGKSRRVSFSKRTGVAEFVTNEATTTWKNFYEEHNKTLESSGNESENKLRPSIGHLGKRIFDQQFQEVDTLEFVSTLDDPRCLNIESSLNNIKFAEQLASLECTGDDRKLPVPQQNFELSNFTDHQSRLFGDDLAISGMGEITDKISVNFSVMQTISSTGEKDDLNEIQRDIERVQADLCLKPTGQGIFKDGKDFSQYIEVDLNMTCVAPINDVSDMSITDPIRVPKVQDLSKSLNNVSTDKKSSLNIDWVVDKENVAVNPYVAPKESENFAVNEEPDKVLVFDGKRLTIQSDKNSISEKVNYYQTLLPKQQPAQKFQRKTIVLNVNDDLPNFIDNPHASVSQINSNSVSFHAALDSESDISMTQPLSSRVDINLDEFKTLLYENESDNISMTQAVPTNILTGKRNTVFYESDSGNISVTQALTSNIMTSDNHSSILNGKGKSVLYESYSGDISVTQAVPSNIILPEKRKTILFETDSGDISVTQAVTSNLIMPEKRKTILFETDSGDISVTQAVTSNLIMPEKRKTILYETESADISITQAVPSNLILPEKIKPVINESDSENITVSQTVPSNFILPEKRKTIVHESDSGDISVTQAAPLSVILLEKRKTIIYETESADISVTQAVPSNLIMAEKRKTILTESDSEDISVTQAVPSNLIMPEQRQTIINESDSEGEDITSSQTIPSNLILPVKGNTIIYESDSGDISVTQAVPSNLISERRKTAFYETESADISVAHIVSSNLILPEKRKTIETDLDNISVTEIVSSNFILAGRDKQLTETQKLNYDYDAADNISVFQAAPTNLILSRKSNTSSHEIDSGNISLTQAASSNRKLEQKSDVRRKTIVQEDDAGNISITQAVPATLIWPETKKTLIYKSDTGDISVTQVAPLVQFPSMALSGIPHESRKTVLYQEEAANISLVTQPMHTTDLDLHKQAKKLNVTETDSDIYVSHPLSANFNLSENVGASEKINTMLNEICMGDIYVTQTVPDNIILTDSTVVKSNKTLYSESDTDFTQASSSSNSYSQKVKKLDYYNADVSLNLESEIFITDDEKRKTVVFDSDKKNGELLIFEKGLEKEVLIIKPTTFDDGINNMSKINPTKAEFVSYKEAEESTMGKLLNLPQGIVVYQTVTDAALRPPSPAPLLSKTELGDFKSAEPNTISFDSMTTASKTSSHSDEKLTQEKPLMETYNNDDKKEETTSEYSEDIKPNISKMEIKVKNALLNDLLDMSNASIYDGVDDKNVMAKIETENYSGDTLVKAETDEEKHSEDNSATTGTEENSNSSLFFITKESEDETQTEKPNDDQTFMEQSEQFKSIKTAELQKIQSLSHPLLEFKEENHSVIDSIKEKIDKLKSNAKGENTTLPINRHFEKIVSSDLVKKEEPVKKTSVKKKSFRDPDNTKELLELLSDFTDKEEEDNPIKPSKRTSSIALADKTESFEPRRLSRAPLLRQSIALSRENLLSNISMAQAVLEKSPFNDSDIMDDTVNEYPTDKITQSKKCVHMDNEVVKKLNFEDESFACASTHSYTKASPLKKTAFGETSYMKEKKKEKVIPSYLKDVSDGIKQLMSDLVKPMTEVLPFESAGVDKNLKKKSSTISTQVQANLCTSSQIDIDSNVRSQNSSYSNMNGSVKKALQSAVRPISPPLKKGLFSETELQLDLHHPSVHQTAPGHVLVFDHNNPLNNILLTPIDFSQAHGYNPRKSTDTLVSSDSINYHLDGSNSERSQSGQVSFREREDDMDKVTTQYNVHSHVITPLAIPQAGDASFEKISEAVSMESNLSKPFSTDQSIGAPVMVLKDSEVNTLIVMKANKDLLDTSSSLTLVDDALAHEAFAVNIDSDTTQSEENNANCKEKSPVRLIHKIDKESSRSTREIKDSDVTSNNEDLNESTKKSDKTKKRCHSLTKRSHKHCTISTTEVTPKPLNKVKKLSTSPPKAIPEQEPNKTSEYNMASSPEPQANRSRRGTANPKNSKCKAATTVTVQQLITEHHIESNRDQPTLNKQIVHVLSGQNLDLPAVAEESVSSLPEAPSSDASSTHPSERYAPSLAGGGPQRARTPSGASPMDWQPELLNEPSSKNLLSECDSSVNVITKIDILPFMGSRECEWESWGSDAWSFLLLHGRLRLGVRLAHRVGNAARTCVRADTPVLDVTLDALHRDMKNPVAVLCVRFAEETMRFYAGRGCARAGAVPALLRRCAGVARVALRWGRAMHEARAHLAYTLTDDGKLALKVANVPLRSVWEVSMRLELVLSDTSEVPWPCAKDVCVRAVVSDVDVSEAEVHRVLSHAGRDWGHAPRCIWKIFKYLKHKTRDDDMLLGL